MEITMGTLVIPITPMAEHAVPQADTVVRNTHHVLQVEAETL